MELTVNIKAKEDVLFFFKKLNSFIQSTLQSSRFRELYSTFGSNELLKNIRANRACEVADFYSKNNKKQKALKLYQFIVKTFPTSKRAQKRLNDVLKK